MILSMSVAPSRNMRNHEQSDAAKSRPENRAKDDRQFGDEVHEFDLVRRPPMLHANKADVPASDTLAPDAAEPDAAEPGVHAVRSDGSDQLSQNAMLLLAKVAHEMRTPLGAIAGFAQLLKSEKFGPLGDPKYREYVDLILTGATYTIALLDDLLDPDKARAGSFLFAEEPVDLAKIVALSVDALQPLAEHRNIAFHLEVEPSARQVLANSRALQQILFNLLSNAIKVSQPHSEVGVFIRTADDGSVRLGVSDTGAGDSAALRAKSRAPLDTVALMGGLEDGHGLGLPLTRNIAEAIGAGFHIKSAATQGTMIEIAFPHDRLLTEPGS